MAISKIRYIRLDLIDRPKKVARLDISNVAIRELADSIREKGLLQPIKVNEENGRYQIIFGDRRFLAVQALGWEKVEAIVGEVDEATILLERAIENLQRQDLTALEEAHEFDRLIKDTKLSIAKIAKFTGKSAGTIKRTIEILKFPDYLQLALHQGKVSKGVAEELNACRDPEQKEYFTELAVEHGITVAIARQWVNDHKKEQRGTQNDGDKGGSLEYTPKSEPVYVTCFLCQGPTEIMQTRTLTVCGDCGDELQKIVESKS